MEELQQDKSVSAIDIHVRSGRLAASRADADNGLIADHSPRLFLVLSFLYSNHHLLVLAATFSPVVWVI
jgi:hypothetical protein